MNTTIPSFERDPSMIFLFQNPIIATVIFTFATLIFLGITIYAAKFSEWAALISGSVTFMSVIVTVWFALRILGGG